MHSTPLDKNDGLDFFERFKNLRNVKDTKKFCFIYECTILGIEVGKMVSHQVHPLYCFGPKMTFASFLEHSSNVKRCKTCVSGVHAIFRGTEIAKIIFHQMHSFLSLGPKIMIVSVWNILESFGM
jgi:hypothetical protein